MENEKYNGWSNYETWLVNLWLTNDAGTYALALDAAKGGDVWEAESRLADLADEITEQPPSFAGDLVRASLTRVDWREIAESLRAE